MADAAKLPSLTVLSGPMAGTQFLIEDAVDNVLIGSDASCRFCLDVEGVSPIHARLWVDLAGITVYDTNSPAGVFVNDDRVSDQSPLRNGDILWLGRPGDETSTMMQCRVPASASETSGAAAPLATHDVPAGDPTSTVAFMSPFAAAPPEDVVVAEVVEPSEVDDEPAEVDDVAREDAEEPSHEAGAPPDEDAMTSTIIASAEELGVGFAIVEPEIEPTLLQRPETPADDAPEEGGIEASEPEPEAAHPHAFDDELTHALPPVEAAAPASSFPEPEDDDASPTVMMPAPDDHDSMRFDVDIPRSSSLPPAEHAFEEDIDETMVMSHQREMEPTVAQRPSARPLVAPPVEMPFDDDEASPTVIVHRVEDIPRPPAPPPPAVAPEPRAPEPPAPAPPPPAPVAPRAPLPPVPARPTAPSVVEPPRPAPRAAAVPARPSPAAAPMPVVPPSEPPAKKSSGSGSGMVIGLAVLVLAIAAGAGYFFFLRPSAAPAVPPASQAAATLPPAQTLPTAPVETVPPAPEATPVPEEEVTVVPGATPRPKPSPLPSASARPGVPSPAATPRPAPGTPATTVPPQQAAAAVRVAGLMAQAQSAATGGNYDAAITQYDEVLKLDPQNPGAQAGKASAVAARTAAKKGFVTGRTVVQAGKAKANLSGFDTADVSVQKAPDFSGRLEFSVSPSRPKAGDSYTLQVTLVNDGKKAIKLSGMSVSTVVNGARTGGPMAPRVREVAPQQRAVLEELPGVWPADVATWSTEVQVTAGKDESLKGSVSWR